LYHPNVGARSHRSKPCEADRGWWRKRELFRGRLGEGTILRVAALVRVMERRVRTGGLPSGALQGPLLHT